MTQQDTFDTLKYGYVPITELLEHAKTEQVNLDQFEYDDIDECYRYGQQFRLLWDGDFYYIDCFINPPNSEFDNTDFVTVNFCSGICLNDEEKRYFPPLMDHQMSFTIHSRQQFIEAIYHWPQFVHTFYGIMLAHRIEILEDIDKVVESENNIKPKTESTKSDYIEYMNEFPLIIANDIQKVINFEIIKNYIDDVDTDPVYLGNGIWINPMTGKIM